MITEAAANGHWVIFENCCLANGWMPKLEILFVNILKTNEINDDFRMWFVTESMETFPLILLRRGIQIVSEPPQEISQIMCKQYNRPPLNSDKFFNNAFPAPLSLIWHRFVFALNAFHAVAQMRAKFDAVGWTIPYNFNDDLLRCSISQLRGFIKQFGAIPFDDFFYLLSECHYGSEIVDVIDRRLLFTLIEQFCCEAVTREENHKFFDDADLCVPGEPNRENSLEYLISLPSKIRPKELGLHENAQYEKNINDGCGVSNIFRLTKSSEC